MQENLTAEVAELTSKIIAMTNELGKAKTDAELAKKEPEELKAKIADLTNDVAAFAMQAKSCEEIKKKFKAK
jgi:outer membrane murein-binding lipoprotein Lpp